jgi:hypothetical protein
MAEKAPGKPLGQCAEVLTGQLGFASANARRSTGADGKPHVVVTVVEPHKAERIREKPPFPDTLPKVASWRDGIELYENQNGAFQLALGFLPVWRSEGPAGVAGLETDLPQDAPHIRSFWAFLDRHRAQQDRELALWTLANDGNESNRAVAAALLANFGESNLTWWALLDAQRDPRHSVAATAHQALVTLAAISARAVDWVPAQRSIHYLLQGTHVFTFTGTLDVLRKTGLAPELAPALLSKGGGDLILAHLRAQDRGAREPARAFLVHLAGKDHGADPAAWARWMESLVSAD